MRAARIVVIGGRGQIGAKTVARLRRVGRNVRVASRRTGVDLLTGAGLETALDGAAVVIDVSKPSTNDQAELDAFFHTGSANLLRAERAAGIRHHVFLSIVGSDHPHDIPFYRGKAAAEQMVRDSGVPFSIVHATQFFEFAPAIAASAESGGTVTLPDALVQPAAGGDVADALVDVALAAPTGTDADIAGPERMGLAGFVARALRAVGDDREVVASADGRYFGGTLDRETLLPSGAARILPTTLDAWLAAGSSTDANLSL